MLRFFKRASFVAWKQLHWGLRWSRHNCGNQLSFIAKFEQQCWRNKPLSWKRLSRERERERERGGGDQLIKLVFHSEIQTQKRFNRTPSLVLVRFRTLAVNLFVSDICIPQYFRPFFNFWKSLSFLISFPFLFFFIYFYFFIYFSFFFFFFLLLSLSLSLFFLFYFLFLVFLSFSFFSFSPSSRRQTSKTEEAEWGRGQKEGETTMPRVDNSSVCYLGGPLDCRLQG